jgi:ferredoxin
MAHHSDRDSNTLLTERLNRFPRGAPPSPLVHAILGLLFSAEEASLVAQLPLRPFTAATAARAWKLPEHRARTLLEGLAGRALLVDIEQPGGTRYVLPPPMAGFFEFALMRVRDDLDQRLLSELCQQYVSSEEAFMRELCRAGDTPLGRLLVREESLPTVPELEILDYERAGAVVDAGRCSGCGRCVSACPLDLISLETEFPAGRGRKRAQIDASLCLGCGVCARACPLGALAMAGRGRRHITPLNTRHRTILMAIERGRLQHLIFDNRVLFQYRLLAALFGVLLRLPPARQLLASQQLRSRYLEALLRRWNLLPMPAPGAASGAG